MQFLLDMNSFWFKVQQFIHELNPIVKGLVVSIFILLALFGLIRFLKPRYSADKDKFRIMPLIVFIIFLALACFVVFI